MPHGFVAGNTGEGQPAKSLGDFHSVSRQAKPASDRQVKTSHFEKGRIRPTGLPAAQPRKEAGDGEFSQRGTCRVDPIVICARVVPTADRPRAGRGPRDGREVCIGAVVRGKTSQPADRLGGSKTSQFGGPPGS